MIWSEFIDKLRSDKKAGVAKGIDVSCITNLIFSGAFDSMIGGAPAYGEAVSVYKQMYLEVKDALKSKAELPKPPKDQTLGISTIKSDIELGIWRNITNPLSRFDFLLLTETQNKLKLLGYSRNNHVNEDFRTKFPWSNSGESERTGGIPTGITIVWNEIFTDKYAKLLDLCKGKTPAYQLAVVGVIVGVTKRKYANNSKTMHEYQLFDGKTTLKSLIMWPDANGNVSKQDTAMMSVGSFGVMTLSPSKKDSYQTGNIRRWERIIL